ncbi:U3 small nucleolar RNA-associated protein [Drechslerella dactyloides]|uniref:U3 small nucleolar RNA-associated protein 10 n=1 Tax=Drechslerella dactyloides TaxID=74499 RepID=A0AAD6NL79_DREDA|nr:U3 small nucleolar RNA-associated protein [Drechslerella dactyloides]
MHVAFWALFARLGSRILCIQNFGLAWLPFHPNTIKSSHRDGRRRQLKPMASTLAAQLQALQARPSTLSTTTDPKTLRKLHAVSLLFTPEHAASQDFDTIYAVCRDGFDELCALDRRFIVFDRTLFSEQSIGIDRDVLGVEENTRLDENVKRFLALVGAWATVKSCVKAVEWLVRRFRIHYHNGTLLLLTFLPYHQHPLFLRVLSILPQPLPDAFKFLSAYRKAVGTPIPRAVLLQALATRPALLDLLAQHVITTVSAGHGHATLARFWSAVSLETLSAMLDRTATRSRTGVTPDDVARQILPLIADSLQAGKKMPEFQIGTYMLLSLLASRVVLEDAVICASMESVVGTWGPETITPAVAALSLLSQQREGMTPVATPAVAAAFLKVENVADKLLTLGEKYRADKLSVGLCLAYLQDEKLHGFKSCAFIRSIFERARITDTQREAIMSALVETVLKAGGAGGPAKELLAGFKENEVLIKILKGRTDELERLELSLGMVLVDDPAPAPPLAIEAAPETSNATDEPKLKERLDAALSALPQSTNEISFLAAAKSPTYPLLCQALLAAAANRQNFPAQLFAHPSLASPVLRATFAVRFALDSFPVVAKEVALDRLKDDIKAGPLADYQTLLPYLLIALLDTSQRMRKAAILCIVAIYASYKAIDRKSRKTTTPPVFAQEEIYTSAQATTTLMTFEELYKFVDALSSSGVEGCMLDNTQITRSFAGALASMKTAARKSVLAAFASHVLHAPALRMKTALLTLANGVSGSSRTALLLPLFAWWRTVGAKEAAMTTATADIYAFQEQLVAVVDVKDHGDGVNALVGVLSDAADSAASPGQRVFATKAGERLTALWNEGMREEVKPALAMSLLRLAVGQQLHQSQDTTQDGHTDDTASTEALEVLRNITLTSDIYTSFIHDVVPDHQHHSADNLRSSTRRRRSSTSREAEGAARLPAQMKALTVVLELLEGDEPGRFPELLPLMFGVLAKALAYAEAAPVGGEYMVLVLLSTLTAIVDGYKSITGATSTAQQPKLDTTSVRADLVVSCVRSSSSPQVQRAALGLVAALAEVAGEVVMYSVMPIFTFMGANVVGQDDEYSARVVEETVHRVIPPLLNALQKQAAASTKSTTKAAGSAGSMVAGNINVDTAVADIMGSFVAAFQHVPAHRRVKLYLSLSQAVSGNDYLYLLLLLLGEKSVEDGSGQQRLGAMVREFCEGFVGLFAATEQVDAFVRYLDVCVKMAGDEEDETLLFREKGMSEARRREVAVALLEMLGGVLAKGRKLRGVLAEAQRGGNTGEIGVLREGLVGIVKRCLVVGETSGEVADESCLKALLDLLPIPLFVDITSELIDDPSSPYRAGILSTFKSRIASETKKTSQDAALAFLPRLTTLLQSATTPAVVRAETVSCVTVIIDKYGTEKPDAVADAVETIVGPTAFGCDDEGVKVLSVLCLVSAVRCLGGRIIPALPRIALPSLEILEGGDAAGMLVAAVWPLLEELVKAIPNFMPSYLERMLKVAYVAAARVDDDEEDDDMAATVREEVFATVARKLPTKAVVKAVVNTWTDAVAAGVAGLKLVFMILTGAVKAVPKADVAAVQDGLFRIFLQAFDLRNLNLSSSEGEEEDEELDQVEEMMFAALLQLVFKMNDKVFRPFFARLVKIAGQADSGQRLRRQRTFYGFLNAFLERLGSIVTGYYALVLDDAVRVLNTAREAGSVIGEGETVYNLVINSLVKSFAADQEEFWSNPTRFNVIRPALLSQLELAADGNTSAVAGATEDDNSSSDNMMSLVVHAIGELSATAHTDDYDKAINSAVITYMRHERAAVRLAAVQAMMELYERHKEEWIALLPETMPVIAEAMEDDDERVEAAVQRLIVKIEEYYGEKLESLLM